MKQGSSCRDGFALDHPLRHLVCCSRDFPTAFGAELPWILIWDLVYIVVNSGVLLVVAARVALCRLSIGRASAPS